MSGRSTSADKYGWKRGLGAYSKDELWGGKRTEADYGPVQDKKVNYLIDDDPSLENGDGKMLASGGPLSKKNGIGAGPPTHRPKSGPIGNFNKRPK